MRCRKDRIFINHHWRRRYNDRPANHDGLGNDWSRLLGNDRGRSPVRVRVNFPLIAWRSQAVVAAHRALKSAIGCSRPTCDQIVTTPLSFTDWHLR